MVPFYYSLSKKEPFSKAFLHVHYCDLAELNEVSWVYPAQGLGRSRVQQAHGRELINSQTFK